MHILVLKTLTDDNDVLHRLQTRALHEGLQNLGVSSSIIYLDGKPKDIPPPTHVFFSYRDKEAAFASRHIKTRTGCKVLCFFSDIGDLSHFVGLSEFVDCFLAPTPLHRDIVQSATVRRVVYIPETYDPIALPRGGNEKVSKVTNRACWFGFPESFEKSMRFLLPKAFDLADFDKGRFCIITAKDAIFQEGVEHRTFDAKSFYDQTADLNYAILSHFCYDQMLNTYIKSPNKMITAIVRGMVPYVSFTPSYVQIARQFNLEGLLFRSPTELATRIRDANFQRDNEKYKISTVRAELMKSLSPENLARRVLSCL